MISSPQLEVVPPSKPITESSAATTIIQTPSKLRREVPLTDNGCATVAKARESISKVLSGEDRDRLVVVCGPCSIDDPNAALVYAERLRRLADEVEDRVVVVMRTYFEKPRSVVGWKGMLYDPLAAGECSPSSGLGIARRLAVRLNEIGLPCGTEFLNPLLSLYLEDCIAYGSIGSRTVESQVHRELASRWAMPMGMKNAMDGNLGSAINAVKSALSPHRFFGQTWGGEPCLVETAGNRGAHVILRGGTAGPNFAEESVGEAVAMGRELGLGRPVVVDCSHGNSGKDFRKQASVLDEVLRQVKNGQGGIAGIMLESNLVEGRQDAEQGLARRFGQSITDACIGWKDTEILIRKVADSL